MSNGIDVDNNNDKLNGSTATLPPSDVVSHFICLHGNEHIGITSVDNITHRLNNTMSRCTDDTDDTNNVDVITSTMDTNNGTTTRSDESLSSSEYGEEITMSFDSEYTPTNTLAGDDTLCWYIDHERKASMHPGNIDDIESSTIECNTFQCGEHDASIHYTITNDVINTSFNNTHVISYTNNMKAIHQSTISFNTKAAIRARYIEDSDVDNNESFTLSTMIGNICESITSTNYIGLITTSDEEDMEDGISQDGEHHIQSLDIVSNDIPILYDENGLRSKTYNTRYLELGD